VSHPIPSQSRLSQLLPAMSRGRVLALAASLFALGLGGCISLFPKSEPVQLYRFGQDSGATATNAPAVVSRDRDTLSGVALAFVTLPRESVGDGILTVTGEQAAYISGARWVAPASLMFQEDVERAFETRAQRSRLLDRGQLGVSDAVMRVDVSRFEARYDNGSGAAPTVVVTVRVTLTAADGRQAVQRVFSHREPASENRVGPIVDAYDKAVDESLAELVDWVDATAPTLGSPGGPSKTTQTRTPA
jgi:cholesterol transport system auxiliary component